MFAVSPRGHSMGTNGSVAPRTPGGGFNTDGYGPDGYPDGWEARVGDLSALAFFGSLSPTSATPRAQKISGSRGMLESSGSNGGDGVDDGYEMAEDPASGHTYWFNRSTGHRTWTNPNEED